MCVRIVNLCRTDRYQGRGYYVSLLAEARGHRALPEVKTLNESDLPGFEASNWQGVFAPAGTPAAVVARLNVELVRAVRSPELAPKLAQQDIEPTGTSVQEFSAAFRAELTRWAKVAKEAGIKAE